MQDRVALTASIERSSSHASDVGKATRSTPRALAPSHTSGMIGSCPFARYPLAASAPTRGSPRRGTAACGRNGGGRPLEAASGGVAPLMGRYRTPQRRVRNLPKREGLRFTVEVAAKRVPRVALSRVAVVKSGRRALSVRDL